MSLKIHSFSTVVENLAVGLGRGVYIRLEAGCNGKNECRMQNAKCRKTRLLHSAFCILHSMECPEVKRGLTVDTVASILAAFFSEG